MVNSVKVFVKDYSNLIQHEVKFYKNHWKGALATNLIIFGGVAAAGAVYTVNQEKKYEKRRKNDRKKEDKIKVDYEVVNE